ncbi:unnamed protein product [Ixodes pacificus]
MNILVQHCSSSFRIKLIKTIIGGYNTHHPLAFFFFLFLYLRVFFGLSGGFCSKFYRDANDVHHRSFAYTIHCTPSANVGVHRNTLSTKDYDSATNPEPTPASRLHEQSRH